MRRRRGRDRHLPADFQPKKVELLAVFRGLGLLQVQADSRLSRWPIRSTISAPR